MARNEPDKLEKDFKDCKARVQSELRTSNDTWGWIKDRNIQISADKRDSKSLYHQLRAVYGPSSSVFAPLHAETGNALLRKPDEIKARWRHDFSDVLNRKSAVNPDVVERLVQVPIIHQLDEPHTNDEVIATVKLMNCGKAPGYDGISAEILQQGVNVISGPLHTIFCNVCEKCATPQL